MSTIYIDVSSERFIMAKIKPAHEIVCALPADVFDSDESMVTVVCPYLQPSTDIAKLLRRKSLIMYANMRRTLVRVLDATHLPKSAHNPANHWELVEAAFPLGPALNEHTHVFDGSIFVNDAKQQRYFLTAIPHETSHTLARLSEQLTGNIHRVKRLDTIEHAILRYAVSARQGDFWVVFLQEGGWRVLTLAQGLPQDAFFISNDPSHREEEMARCIEATPMLPEEIWLLSRDGAGDDWIESFFATQGIQVLATSYSFLQIVKSAL